MENELYISVAGLEGLTMSIGFNTNNNYYLGKYHPSFRMTSNTTPEIINKPIEKVQNVISNTVDTFVKEPKDEEKKKSHKTAITAGSSVLVITALIALLNPHFSSKYINKLKNMAHKASANVETSKDNVVKSKFYKVSEKILQKIIDVFQFTNSVNAAKDIGFKWLCQSEKFNGVKNKSAKNILKKCDNGFRRVMSPVHNSISDWFDSLGKTTVYKHYRKSDKSMNSFEAMLDIYKKKLSPAEQKAFEEKLAEIKTARSYFTKEKTAERLVSQEKSMSNLEKDFYDKMTNGYLKQFKGGKSQGTFKEKIKYNTKLINDNMSFWAEDILMPTRNKIEKQGKDTVNVLFGDGKSIKGKYHEIFDIISPHLSNSEKAIMEENLISAGKVLRKANKSECVEYFDKKRDLVLGGAPTDILTNVGLVGLSGIAVSTADNKEERITRALTLGFPAIAGIGASMAMTAMLFSGVQAMIIGAVISTALSRLGSLANKILNPKSTDVLLAKNQPEAVEVKNA